MSLDHSPQSHTAEIIDRFYGALARGDVVGARACCTPTAVFWHGFDQKLMSLDEISLSWNELVERFTERAFVDVRRHAIPDGFVQRQLMVAQTATGVRLAWPVCFFVTLRDGLITRLDEYIDRAGHYVITGDDLTTPGLAPIAA